MTYKPPGPFDSLIKDLLNNVQRNADATMRRLETRDERNFQRDMLEQQQDFAREQARTQRGWTVEDRDLTRENYLTDKSSELIQTSLTGLRNVMPFLIGTEDFEAAQALVAALSAPHGLKGQAALDWASNLTVNVNGRQVNLAGSLAKWQADADLRIRQEDMEAGWLETWMPQLADTSGKYSTDEKLALARVIVQSRFINDSLKDQALQLAGFESAELRRRFISEGDILDAEARVAGTRADMLEVESEFQRAFLEGDLDAMQDASRARKEAMGQSDVQAFWETGYLPEDNNALVALARQVAGGNMILLRSMSAQQQNSHAKLLDARLRHEIAGADAAEVEALAAQWSYERTVDMADLEDATAMATQARAAVEAGDIGFLTMLKGLQESGAYADVLGHLDLDAYIKEASDIHQTGAAVRAAARAAATLEMRTSVEEYIQAIAGSFTLDDFEVGMDGEWVGLDAAIEAELGMLSKNDLRNLGVTEEELRAKLKTWAVRALNENQLSEAQQRLAALEAAIPDADDELRRASWVASYQSGLELLGFSEEEAEAVVAGLLSAHDRGISTWEASNAKLWQEADLLYQQTVGQYLDNVRDSESLRMMLEGGASMTVDQFSKMQALYTAIAQQAQDMVNSEACGVPAAEAMWVAGTAQVPKSFQPELPGCQQALDDANNARAMMTQIANEARFGPDGMVYLGGRDTSLMERDMPGGAEEEPFAAPDLAREAFATHGHDEEAIAGFNQSDYLLLPSGAQQAVMASINRGASPQEINSAMLDLLFDEAIMNGYAIPDSQAPTMLEAGLQSQERAIGGWLGPRVNVFDSDEWRATPIEERVARVQATREWQNQAAAIANDPRQSLDDMPDDEVAKIALRFGLTSPHTVEGRSGQPPGSGSGGRAGPTTIHAADVEATRAALEASVTEMQRRAVEYLRGEVSAARADRELAQEAAERQLPPAPGGAGGSLEVGVQTQGASPYLQGVPGQANPRGSGGTGDYSSPGAAPGYRLPDYDPELEPTPAGERTPLTALNVPPGDPGRLFARRYPAAEAALPALVQVESNGQHRNADGTLYSSRTGAKGITQVLDSTAKKPGFGVAPLQNDSEAEYLRFGRDYLAALIDYFDGELEHALAAYHGGAGHVEKAVAAARAAGDLANFLDYLPPVEEMEHREETRAYVPKVLAAMRGS